MESLSDVYIRIQPRLINLYQGFPVYIADPDTGELVRFMARTGEYADSAIRFLAEAAVRVFVKAEDQKQNSGLLEQQLVTRLRGPFDEEKAAIIKDLTIQLVTEFLTSELARARGHSVYRKNFDLVQRLAEYYVDLLEMDDAEEVLGMLHKAAMKDITTSTHSVNLMILTLRYVKREKAEQEFQNAVSHSIRAHMEELKRVERKYAKSWALGAILHDIGKIHIPDDILKARRKLTDSEYHLMKMHVDFGADVIRDAAPRLMYDRIVKACVLEHHERLDGSGYPRRLREIDQAGKTMAVLDCFEALTTDKRPYRAAASPLQALQILRNDTLDGKFDPEVFAKLVRLVAND